VRPLAESTLTASLAATLLVSCGGSQTAISAPGAMPQSRAIATATDRGESWMSRNDDTSILKKLTKVVVIGTTVDPTNGDNSARAVSVVPTTSGELKKGQLLLCNFDDKDGQAGKGTTMDTFDPKPGSKAATFAQSGEIEGCDADAVEPEDSALAAGAASQLLVGIGANGEVAQSGLHVGLPFAVVSAVQPDSRYSPQNIYVSDAKTGSIISFSINEYGNPKPLQIATGFAINHKPGWGRLGPSGLQYDAKKDALYIADGSTNTVVEFTNALHLDVKDGIIVEPGGRTFKCKDPSSACGKLIYAGKPLNAPVAMTMLPNGNLIVANTAGARANTLVEIDTANGKVLDTKVLDKKKTAGIFGLVATGTNDGNTALFFTDTKSNTLQELEQ
jgi:hypothetical protein